MSFGLGPLNAPRFHTDRLSLRTQGWCHARIGSGRRGTAHRRPPLRRRSGTDNRIEPKENLLAGRIQQAIIGLLNLENDFPVNVVEGEVRCQPSGEKNGVEAFSVPASGVTWL
jgi:hypothetical protein